MYNNTAKDQKSPDNEASSVLEEVISSLKKPQKEIPCKFFYDEIGSKLFEQITELDEYYLTRSEISVLENNIDEICKLFGKSTLIVELGSGNSKKIRILLDNIKKISAYIPVDISEEYLLESTQALKDDYPDLKVVHVIADYTKPFTLPLIGFNSESIVVYYPGSTIGNFKPGQAKDFLKKIAETCGKKSGLLIGIDLKKNTKKIEEAYNDKKGVTAKFNLNVLRNLNTTFGSNFKLEKWRHLAFYNEEQGRIEMHLVSTEKQNVIIDGVEFGFEKDESIHTESSYKYSVDEFKSLTEDFYELERVWKDEEENFCVCFLQAK